MHRSILSERQQSYTKTVEYDKGTRSDSQKQAEPIKLRNLNHVRKKENTIWNKEPNEKSPPFVGALKKPEPVLSQARRSRRLLLSNHSIRGLGVINSDFIPPSPSLERTLSNDHKANGLKLSRFNDGREINLLDVSGYCDQNFDCQPFFHAHDYESRLEKDDYESIINQMIEGEMNNTRPVYQRELEFQELEKLVKKSDYILYYALGIDKLGYFKLRNERNAFREDLCATYTAPLCYGESDSSSLSQRTGGGEADSVLSRLSEEADADPASSSLV